MNTKTKVSKTKSRAILSILLIATILITGAFAFLTAQDSKTNVFTVGNVSIKLTEKFDTDLSGAIDESKEVYDSSAERITLADGKSIVPGQKVIKSPFVENVGTNEAWTYVVVGIPTTNSDSAFRDNKTGKTAIAGQEVSITVTAYAIQDKYKNKTTSEDIWNAYISGKEVATFGNVETSSENLSVRVPLFTVLNDSDFDSTKLVVDNSCNNDWTMLRHNIDGKATNVYRSVDGYDYYVFGYNSKLAAPAEGEESVKTTPVFKGVKLQKDIGGAKPSVLNYYIAEQTGNTAAGETDLLSKNSIPEGYTLLKTEYYMPGSSIPTLYYDETLSKTGYSFDWSIMDDNGEATTNYAYSGMSIEGDTNLLAVYTDTVKQDSFATPNPITEHIASGYLTYSIERDDSGNMYANLIGANRLAADYPTTATEVIVPNYVKVLNNNGELVLSEGYVGHSHVNANDIPTGGVSIPVKKIQLAEWQWDSSTNDYASDEAVALGQVAKKLNIAGTNIEEIKFCGNIYQHNITSGFVLEDIGTIPFSCTELNDKAFYSCVNLKSCNLPNSLVSIGENAFKLCKSLECVEIPNSVISVGSSAFEDCEVLKSLAVGTGVESLGASAFYNCKNMETVNISDLASWCNIDFDDYSNPLENMTASVYLNNNLITNIVIPDGITSIKSYTFYHWKELASVTIPDSVTSIGKSAFGFCDSLTNVTIPNSVLNIGHGAFSGTGLTSIKIPNSVKNIENMAFWYSNLTSVIIGNSVTNIGDRAFDNCRLETVTIPSGVKKIGYGAFNCRSLKQLNVDDNNDNYASKDGILYTKDFSELLFYPAQNRTSSLVLPEGLKRISDKAFARNEYVKSITIPSTVIEIGTQILNKQKVEEIIVDSNNLIYDSRSDCNAIIETATNTLIEGCKSSTIPEAITKIGESAFKGCFGLQSVTIPSNVTNIGASAFEGCSGLTSITIHDGVTNIDDWAFRGCIRLTSITIPDSVTRISNHAFEFCSRLTSVIIGNGTTSIGSNAFYGCSGLTSITIPDNVTSLGYSAFDLCENLTSITIGKGLKTIDLYGPLFPSCDKLTEIVVDSGNQTFDSRNNCNAIIETATNTLIAGCQNSVIPENVTHIECRAFEKCNNLTSITIPKSVVDIGNMAFSSSLTNVTYQGTLSDWAKVNCPPGSFASGVTITCTDGTVTTQ